MFRNYLAKKAEERTMKKLAEGEARYQAAKLAKDQTDAYINMLHARNPEIKKAHDQLMSLLVK